MLVIPVFCTGMQFQVRDPRLRFAQTTALCRQMCDTGLRPGRRKCSHRGSIDGASTASESKLSVGPTLACGMIAAGRSTGGYLRSSVWQPWGLMFVGPTGRYYVSQYPDQQCYKVRPAISRHRSHSRLIMCNIQLRLCKHVCAGTT